MTTIRSAARRLAAAAAFAVAATTLAPVAAQDAGPSVQFIVNEVKSDQAEAFAAWIADYRTVVEELIADGKLSPEQTCAFRSWRVLVPPAEMAELSAGAGLPHDFIYIFDPMVPGVSYSLRDYLVAGLGEAEADARLAAYENMLAGEPTLLVGAPATAADGLDRTAVC